MHEFCETQTRNMYKRRKLTYLPLHILYIVCFIICITSCSTDSKKYRVGVSQCSADIWRDKQNAELRMSAYFHDNVEVKFAAAYDSDERQVQQIDSLINEGIDLLIVAPNQVETISPAIDRAYDKGIPVIVFERKTSSRKYTAFMSADNYEMGRVMGEYIISKLDGKGTILELQGLEGSSPAIERHNGLMDALKKAPGIKVAASLRGDWTEPTAYKTTSKWLAEHKGERIDMVFGGNDRTAMGARKAFLESGTEVLPLFCGIDGLPGKDGGIQQVRDSLLEASFIYPTRGDMLLDLAMRILEGKPYKKDTLLISAMVTHDNAKALLMESDEIKRQSDRLDLLHDKANSYMQELDAQRMVNWMTLGIIVLLVVVFVLFYLYYLRKVSMQRERVANTLWNMDSIAGTEDKESAEMGFFSKFRECVEAHMDDSDLSIDDLAAYMNLSRTQLYRKVKAVTGSSPVELLRTTRLKRAYELLLTTDKSVSEVAYAVGFSAPSYFTKCFKDEFGMVPGEVRKVED